MGAAFVQTLTRLSYDIDGFIETSDHEHQQARAALTLMGRGRPK